MPQVDHIDPGPDTFRILLTTDNHVGYMENDPIRGDDSWKTFSEILHIAMDQDVDLILQGGDLFHFNQPSKKSYYHVIQTLRECCWNDKPIEFKLVSDPSNAMATKHFSYPAEYDNNVNVGIPMYAISGNHDDATGDELLSPLDLLSVGALLNHFGRVTNNDHITIYPLLFNKGSTNLALYGLQSIREERLKKTMASGNLEFLQPDTGNDVQWFNLMCIHQNHVQRPGIRIVEEVNLPDFLDFIFWGHEHDCIPSAIKNASTGFNVLQAGSSIATSLSEGELADKHVFILSVKGKDFALEPIRLRTVRPFAMRSVVLSNSGLAATSSNKTEVLNYLIEQIEQLIADATDKWSNCNSEELESGELTKADIPLPLIRLRVEYSGGYEVENPRYFSNRFVGKVANVNDVLALYRKKSATREMISDMVKNNLAAKDKSKSDASSRESETGEGNIFGMIDSQLDDNDLILLRKNEYSDTLNDLVSKGDKSILEHFVKSEEDKSYKLLEKLTLENNSNGGIGSGINSKDADSLVNVKKSFRNLAKRIRAEATYSGKSVPIKFEPSTTIDSSSIELIHSSPPRTSRPLAKRNQHNSSQIVIDSDSESGGDSILEEVDQDKNVKKASKRRAGRNSTMAPSIFSNLGKR